MERVIVTFAVKEHPEVGKIGKEVAEIALDGVRRVYGALDLARGSYTIEDYGSNTENSPPLQD